MVQKGLEGVVVAQSSIGFIDGQQGLLIYRGYPIDELAGNSSFEETAYLLINGKLPSKDELSTFDNALRQNRAMPPAVHEVMSLMPKNANPMDALRTIVSAVGAFDSEYASADEPDHKGALIRLLGMLPTILAAFARQRQGLEWVPPRPELTHAANFLWMLTEEEPTEVATKTFDTCLILHADHGFNASTFSSRVTVATLSDLYSGITSAIGTLKGPLHGGANQKVMQMLLSIGTPDKVEWWVREALSKKERIMGFGHRVYKVLDPRARILREMAQSLCEEKGDPWYEMSETVREILEAEKGLYPNVDFYSASVYYALGLAIDLYTPIFAMSRLAGWGAHVLEQLGDNRLIRPRAEYTGEKGLSYTPIDER